MTIEKKIAYIFYLTGENWLRHSNPISEDKEPVVTDGDPGFLEKGMDRLVLFVPHCYCYFYGYASTLNFSLPKRQLSLFLIWSLKGRNKISVYFNHDEI